MRSHGNGCDGVVATSICGELRASSVDGIAIGTQRMYLISEPVARHLIFYRTRESGQPADLCCFVRGGPLNGMMDIVPQAIAVHFERPSSQCACVRVIPKSMFGYGPKCTTWELGLELSKKHDGRRLSWWLVEAANSKPTLTIEETPCEVKHTIVHYLRVPQMHHNRAQLQHRPGGVHSVGLSKHRRDRV